MDILITCKPDFEEILARESALYHLSLQAKGQGWILARGNDQALPRPGDVPLFDLCFACHILENPAVITATSVNSFTEKLADLFIVHMGQTRIAGPWPFLFSSSGNERLIHRAKIVQECWLEKIQKKVSRVAKLSLEGMPCGPKFAEGNAFSQGQQRMQMDLQAPSRSFLKLEEAFRVFGCEPQKDDTVVDLGAAPGGWSYSALKRGAIVTAIDNGPLREPVKSHQKMHHLKTDALTYEHGRSKPVDWLLCDILEKPGIVLNLLHKWLSQKWCRRFIVNFKVGRSDPIVLLKEIRDTRKGLSLYSKRFVVRQLYHDREEITLMGEAEENEAKVLRHKPKLEAGEN
ncbi:MAG: hypothetical protein NT079_03485 [Candidatus Omnitrophica bacterium]|nr:hypothetical protein [Candidatus Omnitrophota bacterium]